MKPLRDLLVEGENEHLYAVVQQKESRLHTVLPHTAIPKQGTLSLSDLHGEALL